MAVWLRFLANPKLLGRFMKTKAGRKAAFKWGSMLLKSRAIDSLIGKFTNKNGKSLGNNKEYKELEKEYKRLKKRVAELEKQADKNRDNQAALQADTFALGRQVIEMQRLYAQMQSELQRQQQMQMTMAAKQYSR